MVDAAEYWAVMAAVAAAVAAATPAAIAFWMASEKYVTSLSVLLGSSLGVLVSLSSLSAALFFDPHVSIVLVLRRS